MKKKRYILFIFLFVFFCLTLNVTAQTKYVILNESAFIRKGPGTTYEKIILGKKNTSYNLKKESVIADEPQNGDCNAGWYEIEYENNSGYVCASYATIKDPSVVEVDEYERPWTSPKKAIVGGAKYISKWYISKGQFNSYLKKFNVNPSGYYSVYNHQYMANLAAPYSEALSSYKSYKDNGLLNLSLEFTIPIFENMPDYTTLPGKDTNKTCQTEVTDSEFETTLDNEGFPESYKCKIRILHNTYPNWTFKSLKTGLDFAKSVKAEQNVSSIQGGSIYYDLSSGSAIQTEKGWYKANYDTTAFYLDPRNFLVVERILMFENLGYSPNYTENVVETIISGTFMSDISLLDNQSYASIFVEAGKTANMSAVYLASLAKQESGVKGGRGTSGDEFTYQGITYKGVYNFFNIGAYSSAENPVLAGLVFASGGSSSVIIDPNGDGSTSAPSTDNEANILAKLNATKNNNCLTNLEIGTSIATIKSKLSGFSVSINGEDNDIIKTGQIITINDGNKTYTYTLAIKGDVDGDGKISATDYVKIKNYIMEKSGSNLNIEESLAADADDNGSIGATDYVKIKNSIMER